MRLGEKFGPRLENFVLSSALDSLTVLVDVFGKAIPMNFRGPLRVSIDPETFMDVWGFHERTL